MKPAIDDGKERNWCIENAKWDSSTEKMAILIKLKIVQFEMVKHPFGPILIENDLFICQNGRLVDGPVFCRRSFPKQAIEENKNGRKLSSTTNQSTPIVNVESKHFIFIRWILFCSFKWLKIENSDLVYLMLDNTLMHFDVVIALRIQLQKQIKEEIQKNIPEIYLNYKLKF